MSDGRILLLLLLSVVGTRSFARVQIVRPAEWTIGIGTQLYNNVVLRIDRCYVVASTMIEYDDTAFSLREVSQGNHKGAVFSSRTFQHRMDGEWIDFCGPLIQKQCGGVVLPPNVIDMPMG